MVEKFQIGDFIKLKNYRDGDVPLFWFSTSNHLILELEDAGLYTLAYECKETDLLGGLDAKEGDKGYIVFLSTTSSYEDEFRALVRLIGKPKRKSLVTLSLISLVLIAHDPDGNWK